VEEVGDVQRLDKPFKKKGGGKKGHLLSNGYIRRGGSERGEGG